MLKTPTVVIYSSDGTAGSLRNDTDSANQTAEAQAIGENGFYVGLTGGAQGANEILRMHYSADAEL